MIMRADPTWVTGEIRRCSGEDHPYCCTEAFIEQPDGTAVHRDDIEDPEYCSACGHACAHQPPCEQAMDADGGRRCVDASACAARARP